MPRKYPHKTWLSPGQSPTFQPPHTIFIWTDSFKVTGVSYSYLSNHPHSAWNFLLRLPQQTCRTLRKPCSRQSPPAQRTVCFWSDVSVGGSCPTRARTRRSGHRSLVCSRSSFGRSRRSRRFFSGRQSSPLRLWFGRRKRQRPVFRLDLFWRCHSFGRRIRRVLRSSLQKLRKEKGINVWYQTKQTLFWSADNHPHRIFCR